MPIERYDDDEQYGSVAEQHHERFLETVDAFVDEIVDYASADDVVTDYVELVAPDVISAALEVLGLLPRIRFIQGD